MSESKKLFEEYESNKITREEYGNAIIVLIQAVYSNTGASETAALLLLSAYNSHRFHFPISDLSVLDIANYNAALGVLRGRKELGLEPHRLIENGGEIFEQMSEYYADHDILISTSSPCDEVRTENLKLKLSVDIVRE